jgi:DNA invertase Pin-like site-specific DNA recombinase
MMTRKAIALLRVSSDAQAGADRQGLPAQQQVCEGIAERESFEIVEWVQLEGVSGGAVLNAPRFVQLLEQIKHPDIAAVIVSDFDRLFRRNHFGDFQVLDAFTDTGTILVTSSGAIDPSEEFGGIFSLLRGEMAGIEGRQIRERTKRGREQKRRSGLKAEGGRLPLGVNFDHKTETWSYDFPDAEKVREVFRLWLQSDGGLPYVEIARRVGLGAGKSANLSYRVTQILARPLYKGIQRVDSHWVKTLDPGTGKTRTKRVPRPAHETYENEVLDPPLISPEDWDRAQTLLNLRKPKRPPRRDPEDQDGAYPGFVDCHSCGAKLGVHPGAIRNSGGGPCVQAASYICPNSKRSGCSTGSTSQRLADPIIGAALELRLGDRATLERLIREAGLEADSRASASTKTLQVKLNELSGRRARIQDGYEKGLYELDELDKKLAQLGDQRAEIEALMATEDRPPELSPELVEALVDVFGHFRDLTRDEKRRLLGEFRIRVRVAKVPGIIGKRRTLQVASIRLGLFHDNAVVYK